MSKAKEAHPVKAPFLIQRGRFKDVKGKITGVDQLLYFDYMGSAEFEFGALPRSLKQITSIVETLVITNSKIKDYKGTGVFILHAPEQSADSIIEHLHQIKKGKMRLKEGARFRENLDEPLNSYNVINFWWDIDNNYMFCIGKDNCRRLLKAVTAVRDQKKAEKIEGWY